MPLALVVDAIESVPEALRTEYVAKDGKFHLNVTGLPEVPDVTGLKAALAAERDANKTVKTKVTAWEQLGKSPEEISEMLAAERTKAEDALKKAGKFDEVLQTHLGNAKKERDEAVNKANKERESALDVAKRAIVDTRVGGALAKSKATPEGLDLLTERLGKRVQLTFDDNGDPVQSILDADGKTPMVGTGTNGLATFDDLVKEAVKQYPSLFEGTGAGGGGTPSKNAGGSGGKTMSRADFDALTPADKATKARSGITIVD